jgi:hypothetical protein
MRRRNKPYGWYWANEARRITVPGMDASQALSLRLLQTYLIDLLPESTVRDLRPYSKRPANKLTQHYGDTAVQRWLDKVAIVPATQPLLPPPVKPSVHDTVTQALLSERQLDIRYTGPGGKGDKSATVHPLGLVQHGVVQYLVATFFDYEDPRLLPLHRIEAATLLVANFRTPPGVHIAGLHRAGRLRLRPQRNANTKPRSPRRGFRSHSRGRTCWNRSSRQTRPCRSSPTAACASRPPCRTPSA